MTDPALRAAFEVIEPLEHALRTLASGRDVPCAAVAFPTGDEWWQPELRKRADRGEEATAAMLAYQSAVILRLREMIALGDDRVRGRTH